MSYYCKLEFIIASLSSIEKVFAAVISCFFDLSQKFNNKNLCTRTKLLYICDIYLMQSWCIVASRRDETKALDLVWLALTSLALAPKKHLFNLWNIMQNDLHSQMMFALETFLSHLRCNRATFKRKFSGISLK